MTTFLFGVCAGAAAALVATCITLVVLMARTKPTPPTIEAPEDELLPIFDSSVNGWTPRQLDEHARNN